MDSMEPVKHENYHAFLIAVDIKLSNPKWSADESVEELAELCKTAGLVVKGCYIQKRSSIHRGTYIGKGAIEETKDFIKEEKIEVVVADDELSPSQLRNLEQMLGVKIMDRTSLVLSIFADHARTHEAMLQVELAQLDYLMPRLTRMWTHLSRLGGGIGTRGPGETQLESDKRQISTKVKHLKQELKKVVKHRETIRGRRSEIPLLSAALVGYTNSGKSTLMNRLTPAKVLAEDQLFATLDTTTRKLDLKNNETILVSDTVGFIQKLPTQLVDAFKSTLEELHFADILIHVVDASHPRCFDMMDVTLQTINEIGVTDKSHLIVMNKRDQLDTERRKEIKEHMELFEHSVLFSAIEDTDLSPIMDQLELIVEQFRETMTLKIPYNRMDIVNLFHKHGDVLSCEYEESITVSVRINKVLGQKIMGGLHA